MRVGTADWSIPSSARDCFGSEGSHLERYAARFRAVEINSSFYRPHRRATYERWAATVGGDFRFSVKLPKTITHSPHGDGLVPAIERFADEVSGLGDKLGVVLVQFPPGLDYDQARARKLLTAVGDRLPCPLVCEPRHPGWFGPGAERLLEDLRIARVAADPPPAPGADIPGGWDGLCYRRLHGSPRIYYSPYDAAALAAVRAAMARDDQDDIESWCIFDNTAAGAATINALELLDPVLCGRPCRSAIVTRSASKP